MPVYQLIDKCIFPDPELADISGLLAIGGDLSSDRLLNAYRNGIFPWFSEGEPIMWWSPDPRMVLFTEEFKRSKNLKRLLKRNRFKVTIDYSFADIIKSCSNVPRLNQDGTWITNDMIEAYIKLNRQGYAHSVEVWENEDLVGGLYGISLGRCFFGESMFHKVTDASKVALWHLVDLLKTLGINLIDVQQETDHLRSMGAKTIIRKDFIHLLKSLMQFDDLKGNWGDYKYPMQV